MGLLYGLWDKVWCYWEHLEGTHWELDKAFFFFFVFFSFTTLRYLHLLEQNKQKFETILHHTSEDSLASESDFILDTQQLVDFFFVSWGKQTTLELKGNKPMWPTTHTLGNREYPKMLKYGALDEAINFGSYYAHFGSV